MTHHAPSGTGDGRDLRQALRADAERAADTDPDAVWTRISHGVAHRRRRRRELADTGAAALAVIAIALGADEFGVVGGGIDQARPAATTVPTSPVAPVPDRSAPQPVSTVRTPLAGRSIPITPDDARAAFREAGYDQDDAWQLAEVWRWSDVQDVEVVAGARLARDDQLPLRSGQAAAEADEEAAWQPYVNLLAYTSAGYDAHDADALAARWGEEPDLVRMFVGELVRAGDLPVATG